MEEGSSPVEGGNTLAAAWESHALAVGHMPEVACRIVAGATASPDCNWEDPLPVDTVARAHLTAVLRSGTVSVGTAVGTVVDGAAGADTAVAETVAVTVAELHTAASFGMVVAVVFAVLEIAVAIVRSVLSVALVELASAGDVTGAKVSVWGVSVRWVAPSVPTAHIHESGVVAAYIHENCAVAV